MNINLETYSITDSKTLVKHDLTGIISPLSIDNRDKVAPPMDQGNNPYCAAYSVSNLHTLGLVPAPALLTTVAITLLIVA